MATLESVLQGKTPRCLDNVLATSIAPFEERDFVAIAFRLASKSGEGTTCKVFGYPLSEYNPLCKDDPSFISPLSLQWDNASDTCVFDSEVHGYHGELHAAKLRGSGAASVYLCQKCSSDKLIVSVQFDFADACEDLLEDEPELSIQDYFCNVIFEGECDSCGVANRIVDMDL